MERAADFIAVADNAAMKAFFSNLKRERVHRRKYWTRVEATADIGDYIENFYNPRRRHSHFGAISPVEFANRSGTSRRKSSKRCTIGI